MLFVRKHSSKKLRIMLLCWRFLKQNYLLRSKARNGLKNLIIFSTNVLEKLEKKENCEANSLLTERVELQKKVKAVIIDDDIKKQIEHRIAQTR